MKDTSAEVEKRFDRMLMSKSGVERLMMGASMFDAARELIKSSIIARQPDISARGLKKELFLRVYEVDFSEDEKSKIVRAISE